MIATTIPSDNANNKNIDNYSSFASTIRTLSLTKIFPDGRLQSLLRFSSNRGGRIAVDDLNLTVPRGAIYGLLGPNGAGKTTTIKMLVGLLRPTRGTASICGHSIHDDLRCAQQHLGYMPDTVHRFPAMRAVEFLTLLGEFSKLKRDAARSMAQDLLSWAKLDEDDSTLETKVNRWSAGMQRKLLFIQSIIHQPEVLILDEPTANLDPVSRRDLIELLKHVTRGTFPKSWRASVLISSHDLPEVQEICTKIGFLTHGKLIAEGTQEDLRRSISEATGGGATTFTVTGTNLTKIAKEIREKLGAAVSDLSDAQFIITTKRWSTLFKDLASIAENHPDMSIIDLAQEGAKLESIFLKLEKLTRTKRKREKEAKEETNE